MGVQSFTLSIPGATSLKARRSVVKSLKDRLRSRFNVAVSETGLQEAVGRCELTVVTVGDGRARVDSVLDHVDAFVAAEPRVVVGPVRRELF
ncbi:DUF503 domain-containing protein [Gaopeijia maritima]|uniref:DUF503 domain-containing protein n=1 Tax=Gaopeijia maritima TaxID=3119007 RepID=UPI00324C4423